MSVGMLKLWIAYLRHLVSMAATKVIDAGIIANHVTTCFVSEIALKLIRISAFDLDPFYINTPKAIVSRTALQPPIRLLPCRASL